MLSFSPFRRWTHVQFLSLSLFCYSIDATHSLAGLLACLLLLSHLFLTITSSSFPYLPRHPPSYHIPITQLSATPSIDRRDHLRSRTETHSASARLLFHSITHLESRPASHRTRHLYHAAHHGPHCTTDHKRDCTTSYQFDTTARSHALVHRASLIRRIGTSNCGLILVPPKLPDSFVSPVPARQRS